MISVIHTIKICTEPFNSNFHAGRTDSESPRYFSNGKNPALTCLVKVFVDVFTKEYLKIFRIYRTFSLNFR
jgi:hypothetical protein